MMKAVNPHCGENLKVLKSIKKQKLPIIPSCWGRTYTKIAVNFPRISVHIINIIGLMLHLWLHIPLFLMKHIITSLTSFKTTQGIVMILMTHSQIHWKLCHLFTYSPAAKDLECFQGFHPNRNSIAVNIFLTYIFLSDPWHLFSYVSSLIQWLLISDPKICVLSCFLFLPCSARSPVSSRGPANWTSSRSPVVECRARTT